MMRADLIPAGSFIQNTPTTRRQSVGATPSRRASTQATPVAEQLTCRAIPVAAQQVPVATAHDDDRASRGEAARRRRPRRPGSAWKNRHRRPQFTDDFDAFDDDVIDLDVEGLNLDDLVAKKDPENSSTDDRTGLDAAKPPANDFSMTSSAWLENAAAEVATAECQQGHVAKSNHHRGRKSEG